MLGCVYWISILAFRTSAQMIFKQKLMHLSGEVCARLQVKGEFLFFIFLVFAPKVSACFNYLQ